LLCSAGALVALVGCDKSQRASLLLTIVNGADAPIPGEVRLNVYDQSGREFPETRLPGEGVLVPAELPRLGTLVIYVSDPAAKLRMEARGRTGTQSVSQGTLITSAVPDRQTSVQLTLQAGTLADADGDLVPDAIDNCAAAANPDQADQNGDGQGNACQTAGGDGGSAGDGDLGDACTGADACRSGFCVDGVCCQTACGGLCQTCAHPGAPGFCLSVSDGQDPRNDCAESPKASCQQDGTCDGRGACRKFYRAGTICTEPACSGQAMLALAATCDGAGTCAPGQTLSCEPYACAEGACRMACAGDTDCAAPRVCREGSCGRSPNGAPCTTGATCNSLSCVDGVCCGTACTETCRACNLAGSAGACTLIPDGQDAAADCPPEAAATCGRNGKCAAGGVCAKHADGAVCAPASCASSTQSSVRTCDGGGACRAAVVVSCGVYACGGLACRAACAADAECAADHYCAAPTCVPKLDSGLACSAASQCRSGFCADGVCCATACSGPCKSCQVPLAGTCTNHAAGTDPEAECAAGLACKGDGTCFSQCARDNPDCEAGNYCAAAAGCATRKTNGQACAAANECTSGFCADGVCCVEACTAVCKSCDLGGSAGICAFVANGNRDSTGINTCAAPRRCDGAGTCQ
jgi:hypothetical protein